MYTSIIKNGLIEGLKLISDHGNVMVSKAITYLGFTSTGMISAQVVVSNESVQKAIPAAQAIAQTCNQNPTWLIYVPAVVAGTLVLKHGTDTVFNVLDRIKAKRDNSAK